MIRLKSHSQGVLLPVRAQAGARQSRIRGIQDGRLKVAVTQVAEKGKANQALMAVLATALKLPKSRLHLVSGASSSQKVFLVQHATAEQIQKQLAKILER